MEHINEIEKQILVGQIANMCRTIANLQAHLTVESQELQKEKNRADELQKQLDSVKSLGN